MAVFVFIPLLFDLCWSETRLTKPKNQFAYHGNQLCPIVSNVGFYHFEFTTIGTQRPVPATCTCRFVCDKGLGSGFNNARDTRKGTLPCSTQLTENETFFVGCVLYVFNAPFTGHQKLGDVTRQGKFEVLSFSKTGTVKFPSCCISVYLCIAT